MRNARWNAARTKRRTGRTTSVPVSETLGAAIADGRMCPVDGPVVLHCLLNWISDGTARGGVAGWGLLR